MTSSLVYRRAACRSRDDVFLRPGCRLLNYWGFGFSGGRGDKMEQSVEQHDSGKRAR